MSDPAFIPVYYRHPHAFRLEPIFMEDGSKRDLTGLVLLAGIEKEGSSAFARFRVTGNGTSGIVNGTIPSTIAFTANATMRIQVSGGGGEIIGKPQKLSIRNLGSNWLHA